MKRIAYICCMLAFSLNMTAQIDTTDMNWRLVFSDDFTTNGRGWNSGFSDTVQGDASYESKWRCYHEEWQSGVTRAYKHHLVSQPSQCRFNDNIDFNDNKLRIISNFYDSISLTCGQYVLPDSTAGNYVCDNTHHWLYYYSGFIEAIETFRYGYFEMKCKNPFHTGAFPSFWLWGRGLRRYEEIDIYEFMWDIYYQDAPYWGYPNSFTTGMYYGRKNDTTMFEHARKAVFYPADQPGIDQWHTFGCLWMPDSVVWYFDGAKVNEYLDHDSIPHGNMALKINYLIDNWSLSNHNYYCSPPIWEGSDTLTIDYVRVYQLETDCETDVVIASNSQLAGYEYGVKHSITIGDPNNAITMPSGSNMVMRATEYIKIDGEFTVPVGTSLTLMTHPCPDRYD